MTEQKFLACKEFIYKAVKWEKMVLGKEEITYIESNKGDVLNYEPAKDGIKVYTSVARISLSATMLFSDMQPIK